MTVHVALDHHDCRRDYSNVETFGTAKLWQIEVEYEDALAEPVERHPVHDHGAAKVEQMKGSKRRPVGEPVCVVVFLNGANCL